MDFITSVPPTSRYPCLPKESHSQWDSQETQHSHKHFQREKWRSSSLENTMALRVTLWSEHQSLAHLKGHFRRCSLVGPLRGVPQGEPDLAKRLQDHVF